MTPLDPIYILLALLLSPWWARKSREGWGERMGRVDLGRAQPNETGGPRPRILLHAVSVGEAQALRALVPELARDAEVIVSVGTDTGLVRARSLYGEIATVVRYPLDFSWAVRRFLDRVRPDAVGLVELELWPQFLGECARRNIPVGIINGRLSERSFRGYRRARWALRPLAFARLAFADVQDEVYAERFRAMGVPADRVRVTGSMKWDALAEREVGEGPSDAAVRLGHALGIDPNQPLIVAGSTAEDEEALLDAACGKRCQLLCAPRKPERFDAAAALMPGCVRRSTAGSGAASRESSSAGRFLLDTIGELSAAYELADAVVLGRSFGTLFGSDPAEPAALGKPVLIGPRFGDFEDAVGALRDAGGLRVVRREDLTGAIAALLDDPEGARAMGERARAAVEARRGASAAHAARLLGEARGAPTGRPRGV